MFAIVNGRTILWMTVVEYDSTFCICKMLKCKHPVQWRKVPGDMWQGWYCEGVVSRLGEGDLPAMFQVAAVVHVYQQLQCKRSRIRDLPGHTLVTVFVKLITDTSVSGVHNLLKSIKITRIDVMRGDQILETQHLSVVTENSIMSEILCKWDPCANLIRTGQDSRTSGDHFRAHKHSSWNIIIKRSSLTVIHPIQLIGLLRDWNVYSSLQDFWS